jgi:two-component system, NarL family, nitrate/nitrite response regulator NarL
MPHVVLCDDHPIFVEALGAVLGRHGITVPATVTATAEIVAAVRRHEPDAVVVDRHFGDDDGIDMIRPVLDASPATRVLILTADPDPATAGRALEAGASGFLCKTAAVASLVKAVVRVVAGETVVDVPGVLPAPRGGDAHRLAGYLTPRERQCLALIVDGYGSHAIADRLGISTATVRGYVQGVLTKLGVHSRLEAASFAVRHSLIGHAG